MSTFFSKLDWVGVSRYYGVSDALGDFLYALVSMFNDTTVLPTTTAGPPANFSMIDFSLNFVGNILHRMRRKPCSRPYDQRCARTALSRKMIFNVQASQRYVPRIDTLSHSDPKSCFKNSKSQKLIFGENIDISQNDLKMGFLGCRLFFQNLIGSE